MAAQLLERRLVWLFAGLVLGALVAGLVGIWPHQPAYAVATDRQDQFAISTGIVRGATGMNDPIEALYIMDFATGELKALILNRQRGEFSNVYVRNIAADFGIDPRSNPQYLMIPGLAQMRRGALTLSDSVLYVAELNSGVVAAYSFPYAGEVPGGAIGEFIPITSFQFRAPVVRRE